MSSREFGEWLAFDLVEPGEPTRGDYQAAQVARIIAEVNRDPKAPPLEDSDFLLKFRVKLGDEVSPRKEGDGRVQSREQIKAAMGLWVSYTKALADKR